MVEPGSETVVCLDSAHWGELLAALSSTQTRPDALARLSVFTAQGGMLALTFHHIVELAQHENVDKVKARFRTLGEMGPLCVVSPVTCDGPGSVVDLLALELLAALKSPNANAASVARVVWSDALASVTGAQVSEWLALHLHLLRAHLATNAARKRAVSALSQSVVLDRSRARFMPKDGLVSPHQAKANAAALEKRLAAELVDRRDPRASEHEAVISAAQFIGGLAADVDAIAAHVDRWEGLLARAGLTAQDLVGVRYISEVADLALFKKQVAIPAEHLGVSAAQLRQVRPDQFPTWLIHRAYAAHRQLATTTRASDLADIHLLCHAPYMNALFVDKRTHENVRRVRQKDEQAAVFLQSVMRAGSWESALELALTSAGRGEA